MLEYGELREVFPQYHKDAKKAQWKRKFKLFWHKIKKFFCCNSKAKSKFYAEKVDEYIKKNQLRSTQEKETMKRQKIHKVTKHQSKIPFKL